jgi:glutathione S-transferase
MKGLSMTSPTDLDVGRSKHEVEHGSLPMLFGRSSSHFTRVARIVAAELGVAYTFRVVPNLLSLDPSDYGGNPALRLPVLRTVQGEWFGALNICRALEREASAAGVEGRPRLVWPEALDRPLTTNAQELTLQAMASEVALIMARVAKADEAAANVAKQRESLERMLAWLEANVREVLAALPSSVSGAGGPAPSVSFLEVTLFCLVQHLEFRDILPTAPYRALGEFCQRFAQRESARQTMFRFD